LKKNPTGSPKHWQYSQVYKKQNMSFELPNSSSQNIMNKHGVNGDGKQKRAALIANKHVEGDWIKLSHTINIKTGIEIRTF